MILAIETSTPRAGLSLCEGGKQVWSAQFVTDRSHNSKIFPALSEALDFCDRKLDLIAVGIGPGSYSGVRVGIAAANGISLTLGAPLIGISSLEAYDSTVPDYLVVGDARRKSFFVAVISGGKLIEEPDLLGQSEFEARIAKDAALSIFSMDAAVSGRYANIQHRYPTAENVSIKAASLLEFGAELPRGPIEPHYLRPPYITKAKKKPVPGFPGN